MQNFKHQYHVNSFRYRSSENNQILQIHLKFKVLSQYCSFVIFFNSSNRNKIYIVLKIQTHALIYVRVKPPSKIGQHNLSVDTSSTINRIISRTYENKCLIWNLNDMFHHNEPYQLSYICSIQKKIYILESSVF